MKKILAFSLLLFLAGSVIAASNEAEIDSKQVEKLKEKVQQQTEKLKSQLEKILTGFVKENIEQGFKLEDDKEIKIDPDLTRYFEISSNRVLEIEKDKIEKGEYIFAVGSELEGNFNVLEVYKDEKFGILSGIVLEVDSKGSFLRVMTELKKEKIVNIERGIPLLILSQENLEFKRTSFSKIKENDYIIFVYRQKGLEEDEEYSAYKVLMIPQELIEGLRADKLK